MNKYFQAMNVDALNSSHAISTPVEDPSQILEMFDDVSYDKVIYEGIVLIAAKDSCLKGFCLKHNPCLLPE